MSFSRLVDRPYDLRTGYKIEDVDGENDGSTPCDYCPAVAVFGCDWFYKDSDNNVLIPVGSWCCQKHYEQIKTEANFIQGKTSSYNAFTLSSQTAQFSSYCYPYGCI